MVHLDEQDGGVFVLIMDHGENRFGPDLISDINAALDAVLMNPQAKIVITTGRSGSSPSKYYSNGLDLKWITTHSDKEAVARLLLTDFPALLARMLTFPIPTVACINGHCFAGGLAFAMAHDYRVMRNDRGFICMPAINHRLALTQGIVSVLRSKTVEPTFRDLILTARKISGPEAVALRLVDAACAQADLISTATKRILPVCGKDRETYAALKAEMYAQPLAFLREGTTVHLRSPGTVGSTFQHVDVEGDGSKNKRSRL
jgi:enoyl-CoA hydratase/carnithine racemase